MAFKSKYTGPQVEGLLDQMAYSDYITVETDPIFLASPAAGITGDNIQTWNNKQDSIADLQAIREGASKGATALQSYTEQYKGTVAGVKMNGITNNPSSGVVDLGTVITAHQTLKTINGESILGDGNISIEAGNSDANVQAIDTGDVLDDVNIDYATKTYVDGLVGDINSTIGDINSVLESIINGEGVSLITFTIGSTEYQAEDGMTWEEWVDSDYNPGIFSRHPNGIHVTYTSISYSYIQLNNVNTALTDSILSEGYTIFNPDI